MLDIKVDGKEVAKSVCDLFSPLTESMGLIGDNIKIYRSLSVQRTLKKVDEIAKKENIKLNPPPLKFLIPFLEQASLEDENSILIELWARLLVTSSKEFKSEYSLFLRILNDLSPNEAKVFNYIANSSIHENYTGYINHFDDIEYYWNDSHTYIIFRDLLKTYNKSELADINFEEFYQKLKAEHQSKGMIISFFSVFLGEEKKYPYESIYDSPRQEFDDFDQVSLSILISLGLVQKYESPEFWFNDIALEVNVYYLTTLGGRFYESCMGDR